MTTPRVRAARPDEREAALQLALRHVPAPDRPARIEHVSSLLARREIDPDGLLVVGDNGRLSGAMICTLLPGASSHLWPPQALDATGRDRLEDQLVRAALSWLRRRGAKLAQAILSPAEDAHAGPLPRNGMPHTTRLLYLRHPLREIPSARPPQGLTYEAYLRGRPDAFHQTLLRTYEGTLDCPELDGAREVEEIILGHQAQGQFDPGRWWLARRGVEPVAVLLLNALPEWHGWEVAYVGVVPEARRGGVGRALACKALAEAKAARQQALILAVDRRNTPAWQLYRGLGFEPFDHREVYLRIFKQGKR